MKLVAGRMQLFGTVQAELLAKTTRHTSTIRAEFITMAAKPSEMRPFLDVCL